MGGALSLAFLCVAALGAGCGLSLDYDPPEQRGGAFDAGTRDGGVEPPPDVGPGVDTGPTCTPASEECNGADDDCDSEIDEGFLFETDPRNCGSCGVVCALANATAVCESGHCKIGTCDLGWADCDEDPATGCETAINDAAHCGSCDAMCTAPFVCAYDASTGVGRCVSSCPEATPAVCGTACADLGSDPLNCGACDNVCTAPGGTAACADGRCVVASCDPGLADCDGNPLNGCEASILDDPTRCGGCERACAAPMHASPRCVGGMCEFVCDPGYCPYAGSPTCVPAPTWCLDNDMDRYGGDVTMVSCERPGLNFTLMCGDCNDRDARVHPGAAYQYGTYSTFDGVSWDYDCDGVVERQIDFLGGCQDMCATVASCRVMPGWMPGGSGATTIPECGVLGTIVGSCRGCVDACLPVAGSMQVQGCR